ncbi:MAG: hypothetical protein LBE75_09470 [Burkholderiales bacterium]|jgi:hypothetical protein|nr:hypothetical protein [Burkholderiales bacterium]
MNTQLPLSQWQAQRKKKLLFAVSMLLLLVVATAFFVYARQNLRLCEINKALIKNTHQEALWMEEEAKGTAVLGEKAQQLMQSAASQGLSPDDWAERRINLRQAQVTRQEANELLLSVARTKGRLFSVEEFDISVSRDDEGLFNISNRPNTPLLLTLRGTAVFRTGK